MAETSDFFKKLYNGEYSLPRTFWLYNIVYTFIIAFVGTVLVSMFGDGALAGILYIALSLFLLFYGVHCYVGIWRSSSRYRGPAIWAVLAKIYVVLGALCVLFNLVAALGALKQLYF